MTFRQPLRLGAGILAISACVAIVAGCGTDTTSDTPSSSIDPSPTESSHSVAAPHDSAHPYTPPPLAADGGSGTGIDAGGSSDDSGSDGQPSAETPADNSITAESPPAAERPVDPNEPPADGTYCGDGYNQLAVFTFGPDCATAMTVQSAFGGRRAAGDTGTITVNAAGQNWSCSEGITSVPYLECSSNLGAVRLTS